MSMTAEEIQSHVQALAPEGVKVIMSKNAAEITLQSDADWTATSFDPKYLEIIDPVVLAQSLGFDVNVKEEPKAKTPRTKQPSK